MDVLLSPNNGKTLAVADTSHGRHGNEFVDCAVVIVTYNSVGRVSALLESLPAAAGHLSFRCVVVDNDSTDETVAVLRSREDVSIIEPGENLGYAGAINLGRSSAGPCASVLILNPDLILEPGAVVRLLEALKEPTVGVAVPMLLNEDNSLYFSLRREPSPLRALGDALFGSRLPRRPGLVERDRLRLPVI